MRVGEFVLEFLYDAIVLGNGISRDTFEQIQELVGRRSARFALLGIDWDGLDPLFDHGVAYFAFEQCLEHQRDEEQEQIGFDAWNLLEQQRRGVMDTLELCEAFLQARLVLVGLEHGSGASG